MKFILFPMCVLIIVAAALAENSDTFLDSLYGKPEEPCSRAGGRCIKQPHCDPQLLAEPNLCPNQKGFECCYGFPKEEDRCKAVGGQCSSKGYCKNPSTKNGGCSDNEDCCILL